MFMCLLASVAFLARASLLDGVDVDVTVPQYIEMFDRFILDGQPPNPPLITEKMSMPSKYFYEEAVRSTGKAAWTGAVQKLDRDQVTKTRTRAIQGLARHSTTTHSSNLSDYDTIPARVMRRALLEYEMIFLDWLREAVEGEAKNEGKAMFVALVSCHRHHRQDGYGETVLQYMAVISLVCLVGALLSAFYSMMRRKPKEDTEKSEFV